MKWLKQEKIDEKDDLSVKVRFKSNYLIHGENKSLIANIYREVVRKYIFGDVVNKETRTIMFLLTVFMLCFTCNRFSSNAI